MAVVLKAILSVFDLIALIFCMSGISVQNLFFMFLINISMLPDRMNLCCRQVRTLNGSPWLKADLSKPAIVPSTAVDTGVLMLQLLAVIMPLF